MSQSSTYSRSARWGLTVVGMIAGCLGAMVAWEARASADRSFSWR